MHRWRISFTILLVYSRHFPKPEPDPKPGFSKKAPGLESLMASTHYSYYYQLSSHYAFEWTPYLQPAVKCAWNSHTFCRMWSICRYCCNQTVQLFSFLLQFLDKALNSALRKRLTLTTLQIQICVTNKRTKITNPLTPTVAIWVQL